MLYEIKYNNEFGYVEVINKGEFSIDDYQHQIEKAAQFGRKYSTFLFLVNNIQLVNTASIIDIYKIPKFYKDSAPELELTVAALFPESSRGKESISFYENICVNQGINVKTFFNREEAISWLLSE